MDLQRNSKQKPRAENFLSNIYLPQAICQFGNILKAPKLEEH